MAVTLSAEAAKELRTLIRLTPTPPDVELGAAKEALYRDGYANGYSDALGEVMEILEADE